jgi:hypothetical protein
MAFDTVLHTLFDGVHNLDGYESFIGKPYQFFLVVQKMKHSLCFVLIPKAWGFRAETAGAERDKTRLFGKFKKRSGQAFVVG